MSQFPGLASPKELLSPLKPRDFSAWYTRNLERNLQAKPTSQSVLEEEERQPWCLYLPGRWPASLSRAATSGL